MSINIDKSNSAASQTGNINDINNFGQFALMRGMDKVILQNAAVMCTLSDMMQQIGTNMQSLAEKIKHYNDKNIVLQMYSSIVMDIATYAVLGGTLALSGMGAVESFSLEDEEPGMIDKFKKGMASFAQKFPLRSLEMSGIMQVPLNIASGICQNQSKIADGQLDQLNSTLHVSGKTYSDTSQVVTSQTEAVKAVIESNDKIIKRR